MQAHPSSAYAKAVKCATSRPVALGPSRRRVLVIPVLGTEVSSLTSHCYALVR